MSFVDKLTQDKKRGIYRSIYIPEQMVEQVLQIAYKYDTSFNHVVISMIAGCLDLEEHSNQGCFGIK